MKNISFDNPYLLLLAIPLFIIVVLPFFISKNKDNKSFLWTTSLVLHIAVIVLAVLALAGISSVSVLTKTTVYVVADVSYSSDRNLDEIDEKIAQINESLPVNSKLGIVCFGKDTVVVTSAGRTIKSVSEAKVDKSATDIAGALNYTEKLFKGDSLKRIILITDGNDTVTRNSSSLASTVGRLTENGIKIDTVFLDNTLTEEDTEVQLMEVEYSASTYTGHTNEAKFLIRSASQTEAMLELYYRPLAAKGETEAEFEKLGYTVISAEAGLTTVRMPLPNDTAQTYEYRASLVCDGDVSSFNNTRTFTQTVVGKTKIMLVTGSYEDQAAIEGLYGERAEIDTYIVSGMNNRVPFTLEELIVYDEIVISNLDIREIRNVNAFIDSLDMVVSQYGKSLVTLGDLRIQTNYEDPVFIKFAELLPLNYGNTNRDGRMYTIVLDVSHSMFMASKFTIAKQSAIKLLSILGDDDYVCLVTFSGDIKVQTPKKVEECRQELVKYIDSLTTDHGTDIGMGLEEALKTIRAMNLSENQVMLISDGFSFDSTKDAVEVSRELYMSGCTVSAINAYIMSDGQNGRATLKNIVGAGEGGNYYEISTPERVEDVVFGQMANDVGDVIIKKDSTVNITKYKDAIVQGMTDIPSVSGFIISMEKYDATVPLTVTYVKNNGYQETVPLYAYRAHGNGKVSSFTSSISDSWTKLWGETEKKAFVNNLFGSNAPKVRIDHPFSVNMKVDEYESYIEIVPSILDPSAITKLKLINPNGRSTTKELVFDSQKYFYTFTTGIAGTYKVEITYSYDNKKYTSTSSFEIAYLPEYDAFAVCDKYNVYEFMRGNGTISVDGIPNLELNKDEITTYKKSYVIPLLIAAVALFVVDVIVRKLRISRKKKKTRRVGAANA